MAKEKSINDLFAELEGFAVATPTKSVAGKDPIVALREGLEAQLKLIPQAATGTLTASQGAGAPWFLQQADGTYSVKCGFSAYVVKGATNRVAADLKQVEQIFNLYLALLAIPEFCNDIRQQHKAKIEARAKSRAANKANEAAAIAAGEAARANEAQ
jgi:hypothetical protein